jgi:hypothetical protein
MTSIDSNALPEHRPMDLDNYANAYDYSSWQPGARLTLCNVPWDSSYRDIVRFADAGKRDDYFDSLAANDSATTTLTRQTMVRFGEPVKLAMTFDQACRYNYVTMSYGRDGNNRTWYYFITDVKWAAGGVTMLYLQLDVWTSFQFDVKFGRSFIERGHVGIANNVNDYQDMSGNLAINEGLDVGNMYRSDIQYVQKIMSATDNNYSVVIVSTVNLQSPWSKPDNNQNLTTAYGSSFENMPSGAGVYVCPDVNAFKCFMQNISQAPLNSQGIVSITMVPHLAKGSSWSPITHDGLADGTIYYVGGGAANPDKMYAETGQIVLRVKDWINAILNQYPERLRILKKLATFPYAYFELTAYNGQGLVIKPEKIQGDDLVIRDRHYLAQPSPRIALYPDGYSYTGNTGGDSYGSAGDFLDSAIVIDNLPTTNVVNNSTIAFMTSNRNSLRWQYDSTDWANQKAQLGMQQASANAAMQNRFAGQSTDLANAQGNQANDLRNKQALVNGGMGVAGNLIGGNFGGAAATALQTGVGVAFNNLGNEQQLQFRNQNTALGQQQRTSAVDMNNMYAAQAAKGDYQNAIQGINAKVQDAKTLEPSASGAVGGDNMMFASLGIACVVKIKRLSREASINIANFWFRYGYEVDRWLTPPPSLQVMTRATFWKMTQCYLSSATCPEPYRMTIRGIFEKGVTVYNDPNDIGELDFTNGPNNPIMSDYY